MYEYKNSSLKNAVKQFFGFGDNPTDITIIIPRVTRSREGLKCKNYPLFDFEVSPDDVFSVLRVYQWLTILYSDKVKVNISEELTSLPKDFNRVLIGGPATNQFSFPALKNQPLYFHKDYEIRSIQGRKGRYYVKFDDDTKDLKDRSIVEDYCLITKKSIHQDQYTEIVIAGLRAYGQYGAYIFLNDDNFYEEIKDLNEYKNFQILVKIIVNGNICQDWEIVERFTPEKYPIKEIDSKKMNIFISYSTADSEELKIKDIANILKSKSDISEVFCWEHWDGYPKADIVAFMEYGILKSDFFLAFCTSESLDNKNCEKERKIAFYHNRQIIPLFKNLIYVPPALKPIKGIVLTSKDTEELSEEILNYVRVLIKNKK